MSPRPLRVAILVVDDRFDHVRDKPFFGTAPTALLQGFAALGKGEVEVHVISCVKTQLPAPKQLADNIFYHQAVLPKWSFLRSLHIGPIFAVRKLLQTINPHLVHAQGVERWCAVAGAFSGYPCVLTIHGHLRLILRLVNMKPILYWRAQMILGEIALRKCAAVVCISAYIKNDLLGTVKKLSLIPNAVRHTFFTHQTGVTNTIPTILIVGVVCERKRQAELLETLSALSHQCPAFHVVCVGTMGAEKEYKARFFRALHGLNTFCTAEYIEHLQQEELIALMDKSHALLHFPCEEAFGLVVAESLARGLKLFASSVGGIIEISNSIPGAELFDSSDWSGLSFAIKQWLLAGAPRFPDAGSLIRQKYSPRVIATKHMQLYHDIIATGGLSS